MTDIIPNAEPIGERGRVLLDSEQMPAPRVWYRAGYDDGQDAQRAALSGRALVLRHDPHLGSVAGLHYEDGVPVLTISGYAPVSDLLYGTLLSLVAPRGEDHS